MTLETILRTVLHAVAWSALVAFCGVVATAGVRWMLCLLGHALAETGRRCGKWAAMTLASLALVCGVVAQKANTNAPPDGVSAPAPMMSCAMETIAPPVDWAQSSLVGSLLLGAQSSRLRERPATAQDVEEWKLRGAYDDAIRIPAMGWEFRTPDGFVEGMTVFSRGEFRPDVGHLYFPRPFTNDLAFLPQSKWDLLPSGGESKLWYAATPSNSLLVTWVNGLLDRNPLTPTNFQAEFFPDGSYEYRYGATSLPREPVMLPFDRDGDGLENTVDPAPETAGPDAHNTNDEWKRIVCSNLYEEVEGEEGGLVWKSDVNAAAYYFVDVVAEHGPTPIYFNAGDDGGNLGSPVVVAMQGVTNHIPLLIGVTYSVTSDVPFSVSLPEDGYATVENDIVATATFGSLSETAAATVVRLEVVPQVQFPAGFPNRHVFGVCERVDLYFMPNSLSGCSWATTSPYVFEEERGNKTVYQFCATSSSGGFQFNYNGYNRSITTQCVEPTEIVCPQVPTPINEGMPTGRAGGVGMNLNLVLCPTNVSFCNLRVMERSSDNGVLEGYFTNSYFSTWWNHTKVQGANTLVSVGRWNNLGDIAEMEDECPPLGESLIWSSGSITWTIPTAWREPSGFAMSRGLQNFMTAQQKFTINVAGTVGVEKFSRRVQRDIQGHIFCQ